MPIQSPPRKVSETENMLRLLLCVDVLGTVSASQLWTFVAEQEVMDYVSMRLCLHKLITAGELETGAGALKEQLFITQRGREALTLFGSRLPNDVTMRVHIAAPEFRARIMTSQQVRAAYETASPGDYRLNLAVQEGELPTIRLHMETASRSLATKAIHRFGQNAAAITTYLYNLAAQAQQAQADTAEQVLPADAVVEHSASEYMAMLVLPGKKASLTVELLLPTRNVAESFIRYLLSAERGEAMAKKLVDMICSGKRIGRK